MSDQDGCFHFCGTSYGEENSAFRNQVYEYLNNHYELDKVKKIYLNADGGAWIKSGMRRIAGITHVLDGFHLEKCLTRLSSHMKDSRTDASYELRLAIRSRTKKDSRGKRIYPVELDCCKKREQKMRS
ncbi:UPF0236 family protein [Blautia pseudococcoides]|uniref:UPF0236 family transposase-like protein n=1 Tax=Blautia pseudococcoides TaxID=1796616 RepID=UPI003515A77C